MAHCSICRRAGRALVYEGEAVNACAGCAFAVARFASQAVDATIREVWSVTSPSTSQPLEAEPLEAEPLEGMRYELDTARVLDDFRDGVVATVAEDDAATHFELGVAYREMRLYDDAIREFSMAARGTPARGPAEVELLGSVALRESGRYFEAIRAAAAFIVYEGEARPASAAALFASLPASSASAVRAQIFAE